MVTSWATYWAFLGFGSKMRLSPKLKNNKIQTPIDDYIDTVKESVNSTQHEWWPVGVQLVIYFDMAWHRKLQVTRQNCRISHARIKKRRYTH